MEAAPCPHTDDASTSTALPTSQSDERAGSGPQSVPGLDLRAVMPYSDADATAAAPPPHSDTLGTARSEALKFQEAVTDRLFSTASAVPPMRAQGRRSFRHRTAAPAQPPSEAAPGTAAVARVVHHQHAASEPAAAQALTRSSSAASSHSSARAVSQRSTPMPRRRWGAQMLRPKTSVRSGGMSRTDSARSSGSGLQQDASAANAPHQPAASSSVVSSTAGEDSAAVGMPQDANAPQCRTSASSPDVCAAPSPVPSNAARPRLSQSSPFIREPAAREQPGSRSPSSTAGQQGAAAKGQLPHPIESATACRSFALPERVDTATESAAPMHVASFALLDILEDDHSD